MNNNLVLSIVFLLLSLILVIILWYQLKHSRNKPKALILSSSQPQAAQFSQLQARAGFSSDVVLHVAASIAKPSDHRLAQAIVNEASKRQVPMNPVNEFKDLTGYGLTGIVDGRIIALGSQQLMSELGINTIINHQELAASQPANTTIIYVSVNSYLAGIIMISDPLQVAF
ncbi:MAG TPA: hypothetical protein PLT95_05775 [Agitococcus sp.]|nr:hypothetical protein [Agitococcus sp.]HNG47243.1 hypothetical protein [Agitococcus sp.]HNJ87211.1 hypothetical protein [Agitococcus sp.]HNP01389.1 hypothetical protein [Agitococcus sp.]